MFISKSKLAMEKALAHGRGYTIGVIDGFKKGLKQGREENPYRNCPPNGIRKMFGLSPIKDGYDISFSSVDETVEKPTEQKGKEDPVNRPSHYTAGGIECIDAIDASMTPTEYAGFLKGQVLKYVWRYRLKGKPAEDLKKARYYLDRLIRITEKEVTP